jgi:hypothetical protein
LRAPLLIEVGKIDGKGLFRGFHQRCGLKRREWKGPSRLILEDKRFQFLHDLLLPGKELVSDEQDRKFASRPTELFLQPSKTLVECGVFDVECLNLEKGIGGLQTRKITVKNPSAGWAVFGIEKIGLDRRRRFGAFSLKGGEENENEKQDAERSHQFDLPPESKYFVTV